MNPGQAALVTDQLWGVFFQLWVVILLLVILIARSWNG